MAKKKSKKFMMQRLIKYGAILFALAGVFMTLLPFVQTELYEFTGLQVVFGYSAEMTFVTNQFLGFSIVAMLAIILPLIGSLAVMFNNTLVRLIGCVLMIAGTVLCFLIPNFVVYTDAVTQGLMANAGLGLGAILAGSFFGAGTLGCLYSLIEK